MFEVNPCCDVILKEIIEGYRNIPVANIGDARGRFGCMSWMIKPMNPEYETLRSRPDRADIPGGQPGYPCRPGDGPPWGRSCH